MGIYQFWRGGDRVEVERLVSGATAYFPATVVNAPSVRKNRVWVEHEALTVGVSVRMKEYVIPTRLRPSPPREFNRRFKAGDEVDVFRGTEGCWVRGDVTTVLGDSRYLVKFKGGNRPEIEVDQLDMRPHREWQDNSWVPSQSNKLRIKIKPRDQYEKGGGPKYSVFITSRGEEASTVLSFNLRPHKDWINKERSNPSKVSLYALGECDRPPPFKKLKSCERANMVVFNNGMMVEVRSDERGYEGSWFSAKIISYLGEKRYTVQYQTLTTDDEQELLKEEARESDIRPVPPPLTPKAEYQYELYEHVDAWYNEGWWSGRVYTINYNSTRYGVYFSTNGERLEFASNDLRPCQVWRNGKWSRVEG